MRTPRVRSHPVFFRVVLCLGLLLAGGCRAKHGPHTVPVTGTVTFKGQPVDAAFVAFSPKTPGIRSAVARTDARGRFQLMTIFPADGAMPGSYAVTISKTDADNAPLPAEDLSFEATMERSMKAPPRNLAAPPTPAPFKTLLPAKYADSATSNLAAEVKSQGVNQFTFDLAE